MQQTPNHQLPAGLDLDHRIEVEVFQRTPTAETRSYSTSDEASAWVVHAMHLRKMDITLADIMECGYPEEATLPLATCRAALLVLSRQKS